MFRGISLMLLALAAPATTAFAPTPRFFSAQPATTKLFESVPAPSAASSSPMDKIVANVKDVEYGEQSRKYRRTVYTHEDWVKHRSPDRFWRNLFTMYSSGVYKSLAKEVMATTSVATFVVLYNCWVGGYDTLTGEHVDAVVKSNLLPLLSLPLTPFTLSSPSLGLLLVFKTNTSYQRWDEARKNWGMNINHTRDLVRMATAFYDRTGVSEEKQKEDLKAVSLATWAFVRSMKRHLSPPAEDEDEFQKELKERLPPAQAQAIIDAAHRPNRALYDLSLAIENLPMHFLRKNEVQKAVTIFEDNLGSSERLLTSPIPLFYSRHTARFLTFWLLLLPLALWEPFKGSWNHAGMIPATAVISIFLFGIEELATQMEEPFTILPMQGFCDKIGNWCNEIVSWTPGDNGMSVEKTEERHSNIVVLDGLVLPASEVAEVEPAPTNGESVAEEDEVPESKRKGLLSFGFSQYKK